MDARQKHLLRLGKEKESENFEKLRENPKSLLILAILKRLENVSFADLIKEVKKTIPVIPETLNFFVLTWLKGLYHMKLLKIKKNENLEKICLTEIGKRFVKDYKITEELADKEEWRKDCADVLLSKEILELFSDIFEKRFKDPYEYAKTHKHSEQDLSFGLLFLALRRFIKYTKVAKGLPMDVSLTEYGESFPNYPKL